VDQKTIADRKYAQRAILKILSLTLLGMVTIASLSAAPTRVPLLSDFLTEADPDYPVLLDRMRPGKGLTPGFVGGVKGNHDVEGHRLDLEGHGGPLPCIPSRPNPTRR